MAGTDYASFSLNQRQAQLSLRSLPDYETKSSYSVTILSKDEGGKTFLKDFEVLVTDANDAPICSIAIADQRIAEDISISFQFNDNTFADVDSEIYFPILPRCLMAVPYPLG